MKYCIKTIFTFLAAAALFTGCDNKIDPDNPTVNPPVDTTAPVLDIDRAIVEVPAEGKKESVNYTIENPIEGVSYSTIEISAEEWITKFDTTVEGVITFTVEPNADSEQREAKVTVTYGKGKASDSFTVRQAGKINESFEITIDEVTLSSITYSVKSIGKKDVTWISMVQYKSDIEVFYENDEELFEDDMDLIENTSGSLREYLSVNGHTGDVENLTESDLAQGCTYTIYVYGINDKGEKLTDIYKKDATTLSVDKTGFSVGIRILQMYTDLLPVEFTPSDNSQRYYYDAIDLDHLDEYGITLEEFANRNMYDQISFAKANGYSLEEALDMLCVRGQKTGELMVSTARGKESIVYAFSVNDDGLMNSEISHHSVVF